jgi:S1-C subfamily serine protease
MTTIYDPPVAAEPGQNQPYTPWPGSAGPGGPYGPPGYGGWGQGPGKPARRFRHPAMLAATALVFGLGSFFAVKASGIASGNTVLTTSQIAAQTDPGLVDIVTHIGIQGQGGEAAGTGQVLNSSGLVLTNNHVINGATSIRATDIGNGRTYTAKVVGYDQHKDIAVIQLQGASGLQTIKTGDSSSVTAGQKVVALGNALGKGGTPSVAVGHITGLNASITASDSGAGTSEHLTGLIHHNAPIQPGDSGGPLVSTTGQVVGINTAASGSTGFQFQTGQNSGQTQAFAIPINEALAIAGQIEAGQSSPTVHIGLTGMLGVGVMNSSDAAANGIQAGSGAVVAQTVQGAPAAQAGITAGDVITSVNGQRVTSPSALQAVMEQHHPGDSVTVGWTDQSGQAHTATLTLANGPAD